MNQMQIPEKVIVTVRTLGGDFSADAELPTDMNVGRVRQGLLRLLRDRSPNLFSRVEEISLSLGDRPLDDAGTLAEQGVWDGSVLTAGFRTRDGVFLTGR